MSAGVILQQCVQSSDAPFTIKRSSQYHTVLPFLILIELLYLWWSRENHFPFCKARRAPKPFRQHPGGIRQSGVLKW